MGDLDLEWVYELMTYNLEVISSKVEDCKSLALSLSVSLSFSLFFHCINMHTEG